jgi:integrase
VFRPFKRAVLRAGLDPALSPHDLRHTFASRYLANGGDIFKLSRILGHSSVAVTEKTYAHLKPDAHAAGYGRVTFLVPSDDAVPVVKLRLL